MYELLLGPLEKKVADDALNTRGKPLFGEARSGGHQPIMGRITAYTGLWALPLEAGHIQRNLDMQSVTLSPRKSYQRSDMGRQELGLDGRRLSGLSGYTRKGNDGPIPPQHREGLTSGCKFVEDLDSLEKAGQAPIR